MAKVFRLHNDGDNNILNWQISSPIGLTAIKNIKDPNGNTAKRDITSIPSPFARIDLAKTAFRFVAENGLEGDTIYHKIVSDCLDLGQIFFNIETHREKFEIISWSPDTDLSALKDSDNCDHKLLGDTLDLFLRQDIDNPYTSSYNFEKLERFYFLNYKFGPEPMNIVGGTSPSTLFFTPANNLSYVDLDFGGGDKAFDNSFQPLSNRDFEYIKMLWSLKMATSDFSKLFKEFDDYLLKTYQSLKIEQKSELNNITSSEYDNYAPLTIDEAGANYVEILGIKLRYKQVSIGNISEKSDFVINSHKKEGIQPLVLPVDTFTEKLFYVTSEWNVNQKVPYRDLNPIDKRRLPGEEVAYPYLTISDFLEDYAVRLPYPIDKKRFFDGNLDNSKSGLGYLLPVSKTYFDYFNSSHLKSIMPDGKKAIEMKEGDLGELIVILRIPVKKTKYITYSRIYHPSDSTYEVPKLSNGNENKGVIVENHFALTLFPLVKTVNSSLNHYRIGLFNFDNSQSVFSESKYDIMLYSDEENKLKNVHHRVMKSSKSISSISSEYYVVDNVFDYMQIVNQWAKGIVLPIFETKVGTKKFKFAIDFGTTNTHIEYSESDSEVKPFEILNSEIQVAYLHDVENQNIDSVLLKKIKSNALILKNMIVQEFLPREIGKNNLYSFPTRTTVFFNNNINLNNDVYALADVNIPFFYEKQEIPKNNDVRTNLKWTNLKHNPKEEQYIRTFLESLLFLIRNKVIINNGDLEQTEIIWLYPSSMSSARKNQLQKRWHELFNKYISPNSNNLKEMSESIAPFYWFKKRQGVAGTVLHLDIGGGTTDAIVFEGEPKLLSSFRFASNTVLGDGINKDNSLNGFYQKYVPVYHNLFHDNPSLVNLQRTFNNLIENQKPSADIISFLFSLEHNKDVPKSFSFSKLLEEDSELKIVFLIFYSSLIYHMARVMKMESTLPPRYITFSGTGSKIVNLIDSGRKLESLTEITNLIFKEVFADDAINRIELKQFENPKELSCIGAIISDQNSNISISSLKKVFIGNTDIKIEDVKYKDINDELKLNVINEYSNFLDLFFNLKSKISFKDLFEISPTNFEAYRKHLLKDAMINLDLALDLFKEDDGQEDKINESLFFYPIINGINNLAYSINSNSK